MSSKCLPITVPNTEDRKSIRESLPIINLQSSEEERPDISYGAVSSVMEAYKKSQWEAPKGEILFLGKLKVSH